MNKLDSQLLDNIANKKALIWDFDGVICFLNWNHGESFEELWKRLGDIYYEFEKDVKFKNFEELEYPDEQMNYLINKYGSAAEEKINRFFLAKELTILPHSRPNDELIKIISQLDNNVENFIWSNNHFKTIEKFVSDNHIENKFRTIISRGIEGYMSKPNADAFDEIRKLSNIPLKDFMFIGDSDKTDKIVAAKLDIHFFHYR